jgi:hypothetical protein
MANGFLTDLLNLGSGYYTDQQGIGDALDIGRGALGAATEMGQTAVGTSAFKPFAVTTGTGSTAVDATGGFNLGLNPQQLAQEKAMQAQANTLFGNVTGDVSQASSDLYGQIRGLQMPEEQRRQQMLNQQLQAQGRGGLRTSQYGGTPEQFALSKAQEEAKNAAAYQARSQALGEQQQQLGLGTGLLGQSYVPQQEQLAALGMGGNMAQLANIGGRTGAQLQATLGQSGLQALMQAQQAAATMRQGRDQNLTSLLLGSGSGANAVGGLLTGGSGQDGSNSNPFTDGGFFDNLYDTPQWLKDLDPFGSGGFLSGLFGGTSGSSSGGTSGSFGGGGF